MHILVPFLIVEIETFLSIGAWPELVTAVISCTKSADCLQRELAYRIIASTPLLFTHTDLNQVKHLLGAALHDEYFHVAAAAIKATVYFIIAINESSDRDLFTELIREIVYVKYNFLSAYFLICVRFFLDI